jgi:hypothetical protein
MGADPVQVTMYEDGSYELVSRGADGSRTAVLTSAAVVWTTVTDPTGLRTVRGSRPSESGGFDLVTIVPGRGLADGYLSDASDTVLPHPGHDSAPVKWTEKGGITVTGTHTGDDTGHMIDTRHYSPGVDEHGNIIPGRDVTRWTHPTNDPYHPKDASSVTETGTIHEPGPYHSGDGISHGAKSDTYYGSGTWYVPRSESAGGGKYTVSTGSEWSPSSGDRTQVVTVTQPDGSSMRSWRVTHQDGTWEEHRRATDKGGNGQEEITTGDRSGQKTSQTKEVKQDEDKGKEKSKNDEEEYDDHGGDDGAPVGDGDEPGTEGNPDGPFTGWDVISLAKLYGDDWEGQEGLETLGDLDALMQRYRERVDAALRASGMKVDGELLDSLGAPPLVGYVPYPLDDDDLVDYDSTGRPPPILSGTMEVGELAAGGQSELHSAITAETMLLAAERFGAAAGRAGGSIDLVRTVSTQ